VDRLEGRLVQALQVATVEEGNLHREYAQAKG